MAVRVLTIISLAACRLSLAIESSEVSLVQNSVTVHGATAEESSPAAVRGRFLVDNTQLKHKGPGLLLRKSKAAEDVVAFDEFLAWGTIFEGETAGEGWVKYEKYFLPTAVQGKQVLTLQSVVVAKGPAPPAVPALKAYRFHYAPTAVKLSNGASAPCRILRKGGKPETYNVEVFPPHFAAYNMSDVPSSLLERVRRVRDFDPVLKPAEPLHEPEESVHFTVKDGDDSMALKMFKKSPLRAVMKMACDRSGITWYKCDKKVRFLWKGEELQAGKYTDEMGMADGETIVMVRP